MRVLAVEHQSSFAPHVVAGLTRERFAVDVAPNIDDASHCLVANRYDLILLDLNFPGGKGLDFLTKIRGGHRDIPIIIVSPAAAVADCVKGLTAGADDYLVKPFALEELVARMRAALRHPRGALGCELRFDDLVFNTLNSSVQVDSRPLAIPRRQLAILESLVRALGHVVTKQALEASTYALEDDCCSNFLEANICRLRRRMREAGSHVDIKVVRGVGYRLEKQRHEAPQLFGGQPAGLGQWMGSSEKRTRAATSGPPVILR